MSAPVYLVDDDAAVRKALTLLLDTVGLDTTAFADPQAFLARLPMLIPGCILIDIRMPVLSGLKVQECLVARGCDWPVIVISGHGDIEACRRAFRNGAVDFLSKPIDEQDLIDGIQKAHVLLETRQQHTAERVEAMRLIGGLTPREREVLDRLAEGFTSRQIAQGLGLSPRTVESHRAAIGAKLGTRSPAELTRMWLQARPDGQDIP